MILDRGALRRELIVQAAADMIEADGLEALSLRRLGRTLGVTAPALYAHVEDKHDLLRAIAEIEYRRLANRLDADRRHDPIERIRANCRAYVDHASERPELFRVMFLFTPETVTPDLPEEHRLAASNDAFTLALEAVEDAARTGALQVEDPLLFTVVLWSAVHGVATALQMRLGLPEPIEVALLTEVTDRLLASAMPATSGERSHLTSPN